MNHKQSIVLHENCAFVFGGNAQGHELASHSFDPVRRKWSSIRDLPCILKGVALVSVEAYGILLMG
jgi:hypothetical protein